MRTGTLEGEISSAGFVSMHVDSILVKRRSYHQSIITVYPPHINSSKATKESLPKRSKPHITNAHAKY